MVSYRIRIIFDNSPFVGYGELSNTIFMITSHVLDMVSYRLRIVINNSPFVGYGELSNTIFIR
jgi:hypothetical protein